MSMFIAGTILVTTTALNANIQRNARNNAKKDGKKQALEDEKQLRKSEVFAETEGAGLGSLGKVSMELDDELDQELKLGKVRI